MWTPTTRQRYSRPGLRYPSDLTDAEWTLIAPLLPAACGRGRPRSWPWREIVNAICYVLRGGIAWRLLPSDFPPWQTTYRWFATWRDGALCCTGRRRGRIEPYPCSGSCDADVVRAPELEHAVQRVGRARHLGRLLAPVGLEA